MINKNGRNKTARELKKNDRLRRLFGIDLCACGGGHKLRCQGICRENHTDQSTKKVECGEVYQIERSIVKSDSPRRGRSWRYGRQKDEDENRVDKQRRREKWERDRLS